MSSLTNKLNESFDNLESYTLNEDRKEELANQWSNICTIRGLNNEEANDDFNMKLLNIEQIRKIHDEAPDFIDEDSQVNMRPYVGSIIEFCAKNPEFEMECQLVNPNKRSDYRVEPVGVRGPNNDESKKKLDAFIEKTTEEDPGDVGEPDEYHVFEGKLRAWWD